LSAQTTVKLLELDCKAQRTNLTDLLVGEFSSILASPQVT
jgi:hypothetical protein